jgi:hypothetical protein
MCLSHEQVGSQIPAKINTYMPQMRRQIPVPELYVFTLKLLAYKKKTKT